MAFNENRIASFIILGVLALVGILWYAFENPALNPRLEEETYSIIRKWDMPEELNEISGIAWLGNKVIACIQDEDGIVFSYDLTTELVNNTVNFSKSGDYEGLAVIDSTAYVVESNGRLLEITQFQNSNFKTKEYKLPFTGQNNIESLAADTINNRLLFATKDKDPNSNDYKGIYSFNLKTKKTDPHPIVKIPLRDPIFEPKDADDDKEDNIDFHPSDLAVHPQTGHFYILEGKKPKLLILDKKGKPLKLHTLNEDSFPQPEGITFSPDGTLYISNEGKKGTANILEVEFEE